MSRDIYDTVIIGGGPAGLTAGIYVCRSQQKALLIECYSPASQAVTADIIENYPGFPEGIEGFGLIESFKSQAKRFGLKTQIAKADSIALKDNTWQVKAGDNTYSALAVILAVGARHKEAGLEGEKALLGKGVSYCAVCDGAFFKDKDIIVVGGGNSAVSEALYLTRFARKVFLVHRRNRLRAVSILAQRAKKNKGIEIIWNSVITKIDGKERLEAVELKNLADGSQSRLACSGLFIALGYVPNTTFLTGLIEMDESGYIVTDDKMQTSSPGIFACGDCRVTSLRQVVTACGDGAAAAFSAVDYVDRIKGEAYD